jgi:hypothetical protein
VRNEMLASLINTGVTVRIGMKCMEFKSVRKSQQCSGN